MKLKHITVLGTFLLALISLNSCKTYRNPAPCCGFPWDVTIETRCQDALDYCHAYATKGEGISVDISLSRDKAKLSAKFGTSALAVADYEKAYTNYTDYSIENDTLKDLFNPYIRHASSTYFSRNDSLCFIETEQIDSIRYRTLVVFELPKDSVLKLTRQYIKEDSVLSMDKRNYLLQLLDNK